MTVHHRSRFHSADDPGGLLQEALAMGPEFPGPAEDLLLSWSLRLAPEVEAPAAAARLLARHGLAEGPLPDDQRGRLIALLRQAAAGGMVRGQRPGGRRGGRRRGKGSVL